MGGGYIRGSVRDFSSFSNFLPGQSWLPQRETQQPGHVKTERQFCPSIPSVRVHLFLPPYHQRGLRENMEAPRMHF